VDSANLNGIPEFWATCLKNHPLVNELITPEDEDALSNLTDIKTHYLEENPV
jgi:nucleosome assembly protein 1-like 1